MGLVQLARAKEAFQALHQKERARAARDGDWWEFRDWVHNQFTLQGRERDESVSMMVEEEDCPSLVDRMEEQGRRMSVDAVGGGGFPMSAFADLQQEMA